MKEAGILLHISSLPGGYGIGTLGKEAYYFIDFLKQAGLKYWQILPLGPTGFLNSPYQSPSIYAGNTFFIDRQIDNPTSLNTNKVDYQKVITINNNFINNLKPIKNDNYFCFLKNNKWVDDFGLYMLLKKLHNYRPWYEWEDCYKHRKQMKLHELKTKYDDQIEKIIYAQYLFFNQWMQLKKYANQQGIRIIGDLPIYCAYDSVEVWANPHLFQLDEKKRPFKVAGVPPDYFSKEGQLWGNPLYDWTYLELTNYDWWIERINYAMSLFDIIRIDHFRGFSRYYAIPYGHKNAIDGQWEIGPGKKLFAIIKEKFDDERIIAEDLGFHDKMLQELLQYTGYPGMKVLQFEFLRNDFKRKLKQIPSNTVLYTGTHDNDTIMGWFNNLPEKIQKKIYYFFRINNNDNLHWCFLNLALSLQAKLVIIPFQDFLGLDSSARMNIPGTTNNNWKYRARKDQFNKMLAERIYNSLNKHRRI